MDIEIELRKATGERIQAKGEDRQEYLARLARAAGKDLSDGDWSSLSEPARDWVTSAGDSYKDRRDIVDFKGAPNGEDKAARKAPPKKPEPKKPEPKKAAKPAAKARKPEPRPEPPKAAKAAPKPKAGQPADDAPSGFVRLRQLMLLNPDLTKVELNVKLDEEGYTTPGKVSRSAMRSDFLSTMRIVQEVYNLRRKTKVPDWAALIDE
jgi:hypothetical protein